MNKSNVNVSSSQNLKNSQIKLNEYFNEDNIAKINSMLVSNDENQDFGTIKRKKDVNIDVIIGDQE